MSDLYCFVFFVTHKQNSMASNILPPPKIVALAWALASKRSDIGLEHDVLEPSLQNLVALDAATAATNSAG